MAGGIVIVVAFIVLRAGPWAWRSLGQSSQRLRTRAELLERARAEIQGAKQLEDSATVIRARLLVLAPKLLPGSSAAEAISDLGGQLAVAAGRYHVRLDRTDAVPDSTRGGELRRVTVRGMIEGDTRGTLRFLGSLTSEPTVLLIERLRIVAPDPGSVTTVPEILHTELVVHGWYLSRRAKR